MIVNKPDHETVFAGGAGGMGTAGTTTTARDFMPLRVVSFNIRYAIGTPGISEYPWSVRGPKLCNQVNFITAGHENAFVCFQEVLYSQLNDIQSQLGDSWSHIGKGRDDGDKKGEFSPIFYRSDVWSCEHHETRWLSTTPEKPSRGWDAVLPRIVTMGKFIHKGTGTRVVVMSTHFDHIGVEARKNSAKLLIQFAKEWKAGQSADASVVLIGGDFNSTPQDGAYKTMTAEGSTMADIGSVVPLSKHYGNHLTYTSFGEPTEWPQRIDFLFIQKPLTAVVKTFGVLANSFDDQIRVSDHRAVVSDMDIAV
ncbi:hypothetical protein PT974_04312 [Cladobotryum mycophilum]|uniref:Endonuclease/exonuclease/phosphatase domain-containing protein n=1 Tax=Cladobotryum mycophilum TaxID=491253 RepID=A0ABR0SUT8_9HYPO